MNSFALLFVRSRKWFNDVLDIQLLDIQLLEFSLYKYVHFYSSKLMLSSSLQNHGFSKNLFQPMSTIHKPEK